MKFCGSYTLLHVQIVHKKEMKLGGSYALLYLIYFYEDDSF